MQYFLMIWKGICLTQEYYYEIKYQQPRGGFDLGPPISFPTNCLSIQTIIKNEIRLTPTYGRANAG